MENNLKVIAFTRGYKVPSSRFRIRQYLSKIRNHNIIMKEHCPRIPLMIRLPSFFSRIRRRYLFPLAFLQFLINILGRLPVLLYSKYFDVSLISRSIIPGFDEVAVLLKRPIILDVDDSIWLSNPRGTNQAIKLARMVDAIIVGNSFLADFYGKYNKNIYVLPTAIDVDKYIPKSIPKRVNDICTIGWIGTSGNFDSLNIIKIPLMRLIKSEKKIQFVIVSNEKPKGWDFNNPQIIFKKWFEKNEINDLQSFDIGVMPLIDDEWNRGKCSFKMLQYLSVSIPVVVSPVGMNIDVISKADVGYLAKTDDDWYEKLFCLYKNLDDRVIKGYNGRKLVIDEYSIDKCVADLNYYIREVYNRFIDC